MVPSRKSDRALKALTLSGWLILIDRHLIPKFSTPARTRGKYKGHGSTDSVAWVQALSQLVQRAIKLRNGRGIAYDENLALAGDMGAILFAWYANVHRAKTLDPNRPVRGRQRAQRMREARVAALFKAVNSDKLMVEVWGHQEFNLPYGKHKRDGKFI
jgi:hypothetical protein